MYGLESLQQASLYTCNGASIRLQFRYKRAASSNEPNATVYKV